MRRILALLAASALAACTAAAPPPPPVAVELFTSQGCSSCPPADAVLAKLASDPAVVAITRPVTYWDALGWKDTLARPENTALQRAYTAAGIPGGGVFTPQIVVGGAAGAVGGREDKVRALIAAAANRPQATMTVAERYGGREVTLAGKPAAPANLILIGLKSSVIVAIGRGENGGRRVRYANVLVSEQVVNHWSGGPLRHAFTAAALAPDRAIDRYAVILRQGSAGPILAARYL